tara:strand:- start:286 stop:468 length:183 start_codon:yes stop_codon:yes gene_type:complete
MDTAALTSFLIFGCIVDGNVDPLREIFHHIIPRFVQHCSPARLNSFSNDDLQAYPICINV